MFEAQLFQVPSTTLITKLETTVAALAAEPAARTERFRVRAGVELAALREAMAALLEQLHAAVTHEREVIDVLAGEELGAKVDREPALRWLQRLQTATDRYVQTLGYDDVGLAGRLRLGKQELGCAQSLRRELIMLVPEVASLRDRLRDYGLDDEVVEQGWAALEALGGRRPNSVDAIFDLEQANLTLRRTEALACSALSCLGAAEALACGNDPRTRRKYALEDLRRTARKLQCELRSAA